MNDPTLLASGLRFPEGPAFDRAGVLHVVELGGGRVSKVASDGRWEVFAELGGSPNGAAFGPDGHLYVCNNGGRHPAAPSTDGREGVGGAPETIQRVAPDGSHDVLLDAIDGVGLNAPNDICVDGEGGMYFTDPAWEGTEEEPVPPGSICYVRPDGSARRVHTGLRFPNGIGLTPDGATVLVTESATGDVWAFPVTAPGTLDAPRRFGSCGEGSLPDGFALDVDGRVLVAGHGTDALHVFSPAGQAEDRVPLGAGTGPSNLCFGGPDGRRVYVTAAASGTVLTLEWDAPGTVLFPDR